MNALFKNQQKLLCERKFDFQTIGQSVKKIKMCFGVCAVWAIIFLSNDGESVEKILKNSEQATASDLSKNFDFEQWTVRW